MALLGINAHVSKEKRETWEKILDAALTAAQITGQGVDIVNSIKTQKLNTRKQNVDELTTFDPSTQGQEGAVQFPGPSAFGKDAFVKEQAKEGNPLNILNYNQKLSEMAPVSDATKKIYASTFGKDAVVPNTEGEAQGYIKAKLPALGQVSEREKFNYQKTRDEESTQKLSQQTVLNINEGKSLPKLFEGIRETIQTNKDLFDPVQGSARSLNPYDTQAQVVDAKMRSASQAFGKYMEGGVLRKEDEVKYRKMFPNLGDTPDVAAQKLEIVDSMLRQKLTSDVDTLKTQGYDTKGLDLEGKSIKGDVDGDGKLSEAEEWIYKNPEDPRVPEMLKRIKARRSLK